MRAAPDWTLLRMRIKGIFHFNAPSHHSSEPEIDGDVNPITQPNRHSNTAITAAGSSLQRPRQSRCQHPLSRHERSRGWATFPQVSWHECGLVATSIGQYFAPKDGRFSAPSNMVGQPIGSDSQQRLEPFQPMPGGELQCLQLHSAR